MSNGDALLELSWLQGIKKWSDDMSDAVKSFMLKEELYIVRQTSDADQAKVRTLAAQLQRQFFDPSLQFDPEQNNALHNKIKNKINRIRTQLVEDGQLVKLGNNWGVPHSSREEDNDRYTEARRVLGAYNKDMQTIMAEWIIRGLDMPCIDRLLSQLAERHHQILSQ